MNILLGLILMPVLFRHLPKNELGVWLSLSQSWAVLGIFDLGFGVIFTRRIAFAVGNDSKISDGETTKEALNQICDLVATGRRVYCFLAVLGFVLSFGLGEIYLRRLQLETMATSTAWGVMCLSQAVGIWASSWVCLLQGTGYVGWDGIFACCVSAVTLVVQIVLVQLGGGVLCLAVAAAAGALIQRGFIVRFIRTRRSDIFCKRGQWRFELFRGMISLALKAWLTSVGYLMVANTDQFFVTAHQGTAALPAYRAAFVLVINLHLLSGVFSAASPVFVSQLWQAGEPGQIRAILKRNAQVGLLAMGCGAGTILALGQTLFDVWLGQGNFVGYPVVGIFLATFIMEHHANVFSTCGRATDDEAYAGWSIAAGILKLLLAWPLTARFGLAGLALSTLVAQALTNDWFMVYRSAKRLGVSFVEHARDVLIPIVMVSTLAFGLACLLNAVFREQRPEIRVGIASAVTGLILAASLWRVVLDDSQRAGLLRRLGSVGRPA